MLLEAERDLSVSPSLQRDLTVTIGRLVDLYEAWGRHDKAATYRALLHS